METTEKKETAEVISEEKKEAPKPITDPKEQIKKFGKGTLSLETLIRAGGKDVTALNYDFTAITGREYADAMDKDTGPTNAFRITNKQGLYLFACAAGKATKGIDATDIAERIGVGDAIKATQIATVFFVASTQAGNKRISNE